jgi:mRNA-degrading endonuclease RelE of RelBE toxin-antitoxin system
MSLRATSRAAREWRKLDDEAASHFRNLLEKIAADREVQFGKLGGSRLKRHYGVDSADCARSGRLRLLMDRKAGLIIGFTTRSDRALFTGEA